jgi:hypothetical protein
MPATNKMSLILALLGRVLAEQPACACRQHQNVYVDNRKKTGRMQAPLVLWMVVLTLPKPMTCNTNSIQKGACAVSQETASKQTQRSALIKGKFQNEHVGLPCS